MDQSNVPGDFRWKYAAKGERVPIEVMEDMSDDSQRYIPGPIAFGDLTPPRPPFMLVQIIGNSSAPLYDVQQIDVDEDNELINGLYVDFGVALEVNNNLSVPLNAIVIIHPSTGEHGEGWVFEYADTGFWAQIDSWDGYAYYSHTQQTPTAPAGFTTTAGGKTGTGTVPHTFPTLVAVIASGGSLSTSTTYYWVITATNASGETLASNEVTLSPSGGNRTAALSWNRVPGATGYKIYRSTSSGVYTTPALVTSIGTGDTLAYSDTGTAVGAGAPPGSVPAIVNPAYEANGRNIPPGAYVFLRFAYTDITLGDVYIMDEDSLVVQYDDGASYNNSVQTLEFTKGDFTLSSSGTVEIVSWGGLTVKDTYTSTIFAGIREIDWSSQLTSCDGIAWTNPSAGKGHIKVVPATWNVNVGGITNTDQYIVGTKFLQPTISGTYPYQFVIGTSATNAISDFKGVSFVGSFTTPYSYIIAQLAIDARDNTGAVLSGSIAHAFRVWVADDGMSSPSQSATFALYSGRFTDSAQLGMHSGGQVGTDVVTLPAGRYFWIQDPLGGNLLAGGTGKGGNQDIFAGGIFISKGYCTNGISLSGGTTLLGFGSGATALTPLNPTTDGYIMFNSLSTPAAIGGDVQVDTGRINGTTLFAIQGFAVLASALVGGTGPANGDVLYYNGAAWVPVSLTGAIATYITAIGGVAL